NFLILPTRFPLAEAPQEGSDSGLRHQKVCGKGVRSNFDQLFDVLLPAHDARAITVGEDVTILMGAGVEAPRTGVLLLDKDHRSGVRPEERSAGDVVVEIRLGHANALPAHN